MSRGLRSFPPPPGVGALPAVPGLDSEPSPSAAALLVGVVGLLTAVLPGRAAAQDPGTAADSVPPYRLEEIAVRIVRSPAFLLEVPYAVSVLEEPEIQVAERGISLDEATRSVPGIWVQDRQNFALGDRITIRGAGARAQFGVRGIKVLVDGIPLTLPDGQSSLTNLDLVSAGRIETIRGPASSLYGNAGGGVLSVETERAPPTPVRVEPRVMTGSDGLLQTRLQAGGRVAAVDYVAAGERLETEGFRDHAAAEVWRANAVLRIPAAGGRVEGVASFYRTPFSENPSSLTLEDARERPEMARAFIVSQGAGEEATQGQAGISLERPLGNGSLRATAWGLRRDVWNPIPGRIIDLDRLAGGVRFQADGALGSSLSWTGGLDAEIQRDRRRERENLGVPEDGSRAEEGETLLDQRERVWGMGPFLRGEVSVGPRWTLTAGARWDLYRFRVDDRRTADGDDSGSRTLASLSPSVTVRYAASSTVSLHAAAATAFQTPTASELSNRPDGGGGFNPDLEPERILSLEVGARGRTPDGAAGFEAVAYHAAVEDVLVPFEGPTEQVFFRNAGGADRLGVELALDWRPAPWLEGRLAWTYLRSRFDEFATPEGDFSGNREPGVPDHVLFVGLTAHGPAGLRAETELRWVDAYPVNDANSAWNPSYRVVGARLALDREIGPARMRPFLGIDNLFGERYNGSVVPNAFGERYYEPAPGRRLYGGLSLPLGPGTRSGPAGPAP